MLKRTYCKACACEYQKRYRQDNLDRVRATGRVSSRKRYTEKYGITREEYENRRSSVSGCEICGEMPANGKALHLDHCHVTGRLRGFLCENCNRALGMMKDDPDRLRAAAEYLETTS